MTPKPVEVLGMLLDEWRCEGCVAHFGTGDDWATLYDIETVPDQQRRGLATALLTQAKQHYESLGKKVKGTVALNAKMRRLYKRLGIEECK